MKPAAPEPLAAHGFRRLVSVAKVGEQGLAQTISASPGELPKIAAYLGLVAVRDLKADIALTRWRAKGIRVTGTLHAEVTQSCVVTLDPIEAHVEETRFLGKTTYPLQGRTLAVFVLATERRHAAESADGRHQAR